MIFVKYSEKFFKNQKGRKTGGFLNIKNAKDIFIKLLRLKILSIMM